MPTMDCNLAPYQSSSLLFLQFKEPAIHRITLKAAYHHCFSHPFSRYTTRLDYRCSLHVGIPATRLSRWIAPYGTQPLICAHTCCVPKHLRLLLSSSLNRCQRPQDNLILRSVRELGRWEG